MSASPDPREGLSPPPANILDIFTGDEDSDDVDSYHPTEEESTDATGMGEEDSDADFAGTIRKQLPEMGHGPDKLQMHKSR